MLKSPIELIKHHSTSHLHSTPFLTPTTNFPKNANPIQHHTHTRITQLILLKSSFRLFSLSRSLISLPHRAADPESGRVRASCELDAVRVAAASRLLTHFFSSPLPRVCTPKHCKHRRQQPPSVYVSVYNSPRDRRKKLF